jgi:hypothetical protein
MRELVCRGDLVLNTVIDFGGMKAIKEMVTIGVLALWIARKELDEKSLVTLPPGKRKLRRQWGIMHWRNRRLSLKDETFVELCKSVSELLYQG